MKISVYILIGFALSWGFSVKSCAGDEWSVFVENDQLKDEAVKVSLSDLKETGKNFGLTFKILTRMNSTSKNIIIVGDPQRNRETANLQKKGEIHLQNIQDAEGYEIITKKINGKRIIVVAGGSLIGDVYGIYWIWDRLKVFKKIPDINIKRKPALKIRYSRIRVNSKKDIRKALRYGLNLVYGENPLSLIPWNTEPERSENEKNRAKTRELVNYAHALYMKFLTFGTDFTFHPSLIKEVGATLSPADPFFWDAVQTKYRRLFQALPEIDGVATFTGEEQSYWGNYKTFDPMHDGHGCDWSLAKRYRTFIKKAANVVIDEFGKIYHHRTWMTNAYEQQSRPEVYRKIFTAAVPVKNLYLIPSFTQHDRWWHQDYNPTFNLTPHHMLAVLESMNYYESSRANIFPTFPGQYFQAGLQSILALENSNLKGASFDLRDDDFKSGSVTAYTVFRLAWNYQENIQTIAEDFAAIHFGQNAAKQMAEIYLLSPVAYKYGLFIEPVSYGTFNSLIHIRVGTFPAQGYPGIDHGKAHIHFLRKLYYRCKPWIPETLLYLDHGLETAEIMLAKFQAVKPVIPDSSLANRLENSLKMTRLLIKTNNLYVKTFFSYFKYRESPETANKDKLAAVYNELKKTRQQFMETPGFGYKLFGVNQLLKNVKLTLNNPPQAKQILAKMPDSKQIENIITEQQAKYTKILQTYADEAIQILHWEGRVDGRDIINISGEHLKIEHLRWDPMYFKDYKILNPLPKKSVTVIPKDIESRPMHPFILEQPSPENNFTVKVYLYDVPGGAGWCKFDLYFIPRPPEELELTIPWGR